MYSEGEGGGRAVGEEGRARRADGLPRSALGRARLAVLLGLLDDGAERDQLARETLLGFGVWGLGI